MITNTELEYKGNLYPNRVVDYVRDKDKFYFTSENGVILEITVIQDRTVRFRYATENNFQPDFVFHLAAQSLVKNSSCNSYGVFSIEE